MQATSLVPTSYGEWLCQLAADSQSGGAWQMARLGGGIASSCVPTSSTLLSLLEFEVSDAY
jgi:hypothetical protein